PRHGDGPAAPGAPRAGIARGARRHPIIEEARCDLRADENPGLERRDAARRQGSGGARRRAGSSLGGAQPRDDHGPHALGRADGGMIYLDEVSELLVGAQAKLLRVIEMGELRRVGTAGVRHVDVRVVAASTRDLAGLVRRGLFRDDLYYRLNGIRLEVPPLRD